MKKTSKDQISFLRDFLASGKTITRLEAMHYGIQNLTARVADLRNSNIPVQCRMKKDAFGAKYGEFFLPNNNLPAVIYQ